PARRPTTARSPSARSSASAAAATRLSSPSTTATATTSSRTTCPRSCRSSVGLRSMLLAGADERDLTKLAEYRAIGGYDQVPKALAMTSEGPFAGRQQANLSRRGGSGLAMG